MTADPIRTSLDPLIALIQGPDDEMAAQAISAVAALPLEIDSWREVDHAVRSRLQRTPSTAAVRSAAKVPLTSVRAAVRSIAAGDDPELAEAALDALVDVRDVDTIADQIDAVLDRYGWPALFVLPSETLARIDLGERPDDPDKALWWTIVAAKAGNADAMREYIEEIVRGGGPQLFLGDPEYAASFLAPARPMPDEIKAVLREEWARLDSLSSEARDVHILLKGLLEPEEDCA